MARYFSSVEMYFFPDLCLAASVLLCKGKSYLKSKQLLPFGFARQCTRYMPCVCPYMVMMSGWWTKDRCIHCVYTYRSCITHIQHADNDLNMTLKCQRLWPLTCQRLCLGTAYHTQSLKYEGEWTLTTRLTHGHQCCFNVGPLSVTLDHH